jgi:6-phosphogluconolactonase
MSIIEYPDRDMLAMDLANVLAGNLKTSLLHHEQVLFAVPGGTTPGAVFDALCAADLDWERVLVVPTDERCVGPEDARSNARLIAERLLVGRAAAAGFFPLYQMATENDGLETDTGAQLAQNLPISVLLLGMGSDMHAASLFPGADGLAVALDPHGPVLAALRPASMPEARISLSARVLNGALAKHLVIHGADKRDALERARTLPPEEAPVRAVLDNTTVHWAA